MESVGSGGHPASAGSAVTVEEQIAELAGETLERYDRIDLFCANAGITSGAGLEASDETWSSTWAVNVLSHVYSARAVLPSMLERGEGYLLHTCSAAGRWLAGMRGLAASFGTPDPLGR